MKKKQSQKLAQLNPTNIQISPDAQYFSFTSEFGYGLSRLRVHTIDQQNQRIIAPSKGKDITDYRWSYLPDVFLYTQVNAEGSKHLYALNLKTNVRRCLTPFASADNSITPEILAVSPCNRSEILVSMNLDNPDIHDVYRVNLLTGAITLDAKNPGNVISWNADIALNVRAATCLNEDGSYEIKYRNYRNRAFGDWKTVVATKPGSRCSAISVSALSGKLYFLRTSGNVQLAAYDLQTEEETVIYEEKRKELVTIQINPATLEINALLFRDNKPEVLNPELDTELSRLKTIRQRRFQVLDRSLSNDILLVASFSKRGTPKYALFDKTTNQLKTL